MPTLAESNYPDMPEIEITLNGVVSLLQKLKPFKACGPDQIPNRILKEVASNHLRQFTYFVVLICRQLQH